MKEVKNKINRFFLVGMIMAVFGAVLFAPYFVSADFWLESDPQDPTPDCDDVRTFGGKTFCVLEESLCLDNADCQNGQVCAVKAQWLGASGVYVAQGLCKEKNQIPNQCDTGQDCVDKGGAGNACVATSSALNIPFATDSGYLSTTVCVVNECTPGLPGCPAGKECKEIGTALDGNVLGKCEEVEGDCADDSDCPGAQDCVLDEFQGKKMCKDVSYGVSGSLCKIEGTGLTAQDLKCALEGDGIKECGPQFACTVYETQDLGHQCEADCTCVGIVKATISRCQEPIDAGCASDSDCATSLAVCGKVLADGTKTCIKKGTLTENQLCSNNKACASGVCMDMDASGVGKCAAAASLQKTLDQKSIETCAEIEGFMQDGKCYANPPKITLMQELDGKKVVTGIGDYVITIFNLAMVFGAVLSVLMIIIGGFLYATSGGGANVTKAKQYIISALVGLVLIAGAYVLFHTINPALLKMKPIAMEAVNPATLVCCKNSDGQLKYASECAPGWIKTAKLEMCATGMAYGSICCPDNKDSEAKCAKVGGICVKTEEGKGSCTVVAETVAELAAMGVAGIAAATPTQIGLAFKSVLKGSWKAFSWVSKKGLKVVSFCARSVICVTGVVGGAVLADVLSVEECTSAQAGICIEKGPSLKNGDLCRFDDQCPASGGNSGKCCLNFKSLSCWGGGDMGFCTNGLSGPADQAGVGTCDLENSTGPASCCSEPGAICAGFKPAGSGFVHGVCSTKKDGHACLQLTSSSWYFGPTYEPRNNWCESGKCSEAGICVGESQAGKVGGSCDDQNECPNDAWCVNLSKYHCETGNNPGCIEEAGVGGKCYAKYSAGKGCIEDLQCLGKCEDNVCTGGDAGAGCNNDTQCGPGNVCFEKECIPVKEGGEVCTDDKECKLGLCADCTNCEGKICIYGTVGKYCEEDKHCLGILTCNEETDKCVSLGGDGDPCDNHDDCEAGLACFNGVCAMGKSKGENCSEDWECLSKICNTGGNNHQCGPSPNGIVCGEDKHCESGVCNKIGLNACTDKIVDGQKCEKDAHCVSEICNTALGPDKCQSAGSVEACGECDRPSLCKSGICGSDDECAGMPGQEFSTDPDGDGEYCD